MTFSEWLDSRMKDRGLRREEVAVACDVDVSAVGRWLRGERLPERAQVVALALLFKVSPVTILMKTDKDRLLETIEDVRRQQSNEELLAYAPEVVDLLEVLGRLPPDKKAAIILLAKSADEAR